MAIHLLKWTLWSIPVAIVTGAAVALFLWLLNKVTLTREQHGWLLYLLPLAGIAIYFVYHFWGGNTHKGNNLLIDEIHEPGDGVPARMGPLVLGSTLITHLFGGSAGREGTAVQMGGSIAALFGKWFGLEKADLRILLTAGIAAGFGAVFGTPVAAAIFAMEVLTIGRIQYHAVLPSLVAGIAADYTCRVLGIQHTAYHINLLPNFGTAADIFDKGYGWLLLKILFAAIAFGLTAFLFSTITHGLKNKFQQYIKTPWLIPLTGGLLIITLSYLLGTTDYLGLGVSSIHPSAITISSAFETGGADRWSWLIKIMFTAITSEQRF